MKVSAVISSYLIDPEKKDILKRCVNSLNGSDETVVFAHNGLGFCEAWNTAASLSTGDFLVFIGDSSYQVAGDLHDLAVEGAVTFPEVPGQVSGRQVSTFCLPRAIYESCGLYDMIYNEGIHYMDDDLLNRLEKFPQKVIKSVRFEHPVGGRTINNMPNLSSKVQINQELYERRWGALTSS
jgi:hypothetical protein